VHRYGWSAPAQWHSTSMRTRQPQPSWPQVNSVPASFAIFFTFLIEDEHDQTYTP
jgi:hypothetical protein